jgi:uncharacterized protein YqfB (UPF0267 family)
MIISFAWTTPALLAGAKTMTRRDWKPEHAARFKAGLLVDAWDRSPRVGRGKARKVATIRVKRDAYPVMSDALNVIDYNAEGFLWLSKHGLDDVVLAVVRDWQAHLRRLWVVEFELVEIIVPPPPAKKRSSRPPDVDHGRSFS